MRFVTLGSKQITKLPIFVIQFYNLSLHVRHNSRCRLSFRHFALSLDLVKFGTSCSDREHVRPDVNS